MAQELLKTRLKEELPAIGRAIDTALQQLPPPCQPVGRHVIGAGGKRLRPFLAITCFRLAGGCGKGIYQIASTTELLHAATLLHDDVLDGADTRRGHPAAHEIYSIHDTILSGDALLALGNLILARTGNPRLSSCYADATMATAAGEILEMSCLCDATISPEKYLDIARGKTAKLMAQSCALGALAAHAPDSLVTACANYGENLGIGFQLVDDALDFAPQSQTGKPSGGDLREGKLTPPLRLYRDSLSPADQLVFNEKFNGAGFGDNEIKTICQAMPVFAERSREEAEAYLAKARDALGAVPDGEEKEILLELSDYVASRRH